MSHCVDKAHRIYDPYQPCIYPCVGSAFVRRNETELRIMGVGINSHAQEKDLARLAPGRFAEWFEHQSWPFYEGARRHLKTLGEMITRSPFLFADHAFNEIASIYLTNAIKVYLEDSEGKRADQLNDHTSRITSINGTTSWMRWLKPACFRR